MGDSFPGLFRFAAPRPGRRKAAKLSGPAIDDAEVEIGKAHDPVAGRGFGDADRLAGEGLTDEDELAAPFDLAGWPDAADGGVGVVPGLCDATRIRARRGAIGGGRRRLGRGPMRAGAG